METKMHEVIVTVAVVLLRLAHHPGTLADFPNPNFSPSLLQQPWVHFQPSTFVQKRQAPLPLPLSHPIQITYPWILPGAFDQGQIRRKRQAQEPEGMMVQRQELIQSGQPPLLFPNAPRFRRSALQRYGKKHPADLGRRCCLNADYCVPWACPPARSMWKKIERQPNPSDESRSKHHASGCICNDLQFCPPGCIYDPTNFDRNKIGTRTGNA